MATERCSLGELGEKESRTKGEIRMKKRIVAALLCVSIFLLTGCSNKKINYDIENTQSTQSEKQTTGDSMLAQFVDAETWEDSFEAVGEYTTTKITIDAQIEVPGVQSMSVIEVQEPKVDAAYREKMVKAVFGDSEIYFYDETNLPKGQLLEKIAAYQEQLIQLQEQQAQVGDGLVDKNKRDSIQQQMDECQRQIDSLEKSYETAPEDFISADNYQSDVYLAYKDGNGYVLRFENGDEEGMQGVRRTFCITLSPEENHDLCPEEVKDSPQIFYAGAGDIGDADDNSCRMSRESAENLSLGMLSDLGFSNPVQTDAWALGWFGYNEENSEEGFCIDGYQFVYQLGIDQMPLVDNGFYFSSFLPKDRENPEKTEYSENARAAVSVTDDGIIGIEISNPVEVTNRTPDVELLPLENVKEIFNNELMNHFFDYDIHIDQTMHFTKLSLIYLRVAADNGNGTYSYIPVWRLCYEDDGTYRNTLFLNAIDGSIVYGPSAY